MSDKTYIPDPLLPVEDQIALQTLDDRLVNYITKMAPGKANSDADLALQQKLLMNNVFEYALNLPAHLFHKAWAQILNRVHQNITGCFSLAYSARGLAYMQVDQKTRRNFERLLTLTYTTADPKARQYSIKQVHLDLILAGLPNEVQRQKLQDFYTFQ